MNGIRAYSATALTRGVATDVIEGVAAMRRARFCGLELRPAEHAWIVPRDQIDDARTNAIHAPRLRIANQIEWTAVLDGKSARNLVVLADSRMLIIQVAAQRAADCAAAP